MIQYKTKFAIIFVILTVANLLALNNTDLDSTVYTRNDILQMGVLNTADLIKRNIYYSFFTTDGSNTYAVTNNPAKDNNDPAIFINNHKIDISILNSAALNTIPLSVTSIDSAIFYKPHSFVNGYYCRNGAIKLISDLDKNEVYGGIFIGNEINDPGPYLFVEGKQTRNVDKVNLDGFASFFGKYKELGGCFSFQRDQRFFTDEHIYKRHSVTASGDARKSYFLSLDGSLKNSDLFTSFVSNEENIFLNAIGNEIPIHSLSWNLSYFLNLNMLKMAVSNTLTDIHKYTSKAADPNHFDFLQNTSNISVFFELNKHNFKYTLLNKAFKTGKTPKNFTFFTPSYSFRNNSINLHLETTFHSDHIQNFNIFAGYIKPFLDSYTFSVDASASKESFMDNHEFPYLTLQNIRTFTDTNLLFTNNLNSNYSHNANLLLSLTYKGDLFGCRLSSNNNFYKDLIFLKQNFVMNYADYRFYSPVFVENINHGITSSLDFRLDFHFKKIHWENNFEYIIYKDGTDSFEELFDRNSQYVMNSSFSFDMNSRMFLNLNFNFLGKRYFMEYDSSEEAFCGKIKDMAILDINFTKYFLRDHLKAILSFQNVLNRHFISHPIGAAKDFTLYTKAEFSF
ncbi:MAG: hypothetical protein Q4F84_03560 [Fibrobacter sp.]|nr:hypothetical protein [Fibrobacter sp.]